MPEWIVEELIGNYEKCKAEEICKNSNLKSKIAIRINTLKTTENELIKVLEEKKIIYNKTEYDNFLILEKVKNIENMQEFKEGYFTIQDISAGQTAKILNPQPGEYVLDACSAPGGKTTYMAELMRNNGKIDAWDIHEHRTKLVEKNAKRLGINIIDTKVKDATVYDENLNEKYDKILLDVPCLGIGVIKRKPDIKWQRKKEDVEEITKIQKQILNNCSKYLKKGGNIVYSTCSILCAENERIIQEFLEKNENFEIVENTEICIFSDMEKDGFFICKMHKK